MKKHTQQQQMITWTTTYNKHKWNFELAQLQTCTTTKKTMVGMSTWTTSLPPSTGTSAIVPPPPIQSLFSKCVNAFDRFYLSSCSYCLEFKDEIISLDWDSTFPIKVCTPKDWQRHNETHWLGTSSKQSFGEICHGLYFKVFVFIILNIIFIFTSKTLTKLF